MLRRGDKDSALNYVWDSIFVGDEKLGTHDNWYIGFDTSCPLTYPSQQTEESWHQHGVIKALEGEMNASTASLLEVQLPRILKLDAALNSDQLCFRMKTEWIPTAMWQKALKLVQDPIKYIKAESVNADLNVYYVLSLSQDRYQSLTDQLVCQYKDLRKGFKPVNTSGKLERVLEIMEAVHTVEETLEGDRRIALHRSNPIGLKCNICKTFAMLGICSHVLAITHCIMKTYDEEDRLTWRHCDVERMCMPINENDAQLAGASKHAAKGKKALEVNKSLKKGQYKNSKIRRIAERNKEKAEQKKAKKATQKARDAAARSVVNNMSPAAKKKATTRMAAKSKEPPVDKTRYDSSEEDELGEDSSDFEYTPVESPLANCI